MIRSLRTRLVLISTLVSGVAIIGVSILAWYYMKQSVRERVDLRLEAISGRIIRQMHPRMVQDQLKSRLKITHGYDIGEGNLELVLYDEILYSSLDKKSEFLSDLPEGFPRKPAESIPRPEWGFEKRGPKKGLLEKGKGPFSKERTVEGSPANGPARADAFSGPGVIDRQYVTMNSEGKEWRAIANHERGYRVLAAVDLTQAVSELRGLERGLVVGIPLAIALIGFGGWVVVDKAMQPVRYIAEAASQVTAQDLTARIADSRNSDPDFEHLIEVLNGMMDRLEIGFSHANRFSADVSHELKTPITVMQGEIESALRTCEPGTDEENRLLVLRGETDRLKSIIRSLMLLSQADVGELIRKTASMELSEELQSLVEDAEILAESGKITIQSEIAPEIVIEGDATLMRQALLNLINNAIKYNEPNGYVRISLECSNQEVSVSFENSGEGIPGDDHERVFDRFYRADQSRSRQIDGFGLGLSLTRAIIEGHGGRIRLDETAEKVTRFVVTLSAQTSRS